MKPPKTGTCEVHKYVLRDATFRKVYYCDRCKAWICADCQDKYFRRFLAWLFRWISKLIKNSYVT